MQFRQLEYLVALAREQHFARAAMACHVSQPALSEAIRKLERELGVPLVQRGHSFHGLTAEGERVVRWARRILAEQDALKQDVAALRTGLNGQLRIGVIPAATTTSALLIEAFCALHPLPRVQVSAALASGEITRRLREFELDAGITYDVGDDTAGMAVTPLYDEQMVLVAARDLLPEAATVTWNDVVGLPMCLLSTDMRGRQLVDEVLAGEGLTLTPQIETDSIAALYAQVCTGRFASLVPHPWGYPFRLPSYLRAVPIAGPRVRSGVVLLTPAGAASSALGRALADVAAASRLADRLGPGPLIEAV